MRLNVQGTDTPSCTTAQLVNLGSTADGHLGNLGGATFNRLLYASLHTRYDHYEHSVNVFINNYRFWHF